MLVIFEARSGLLSWYLLRSNIVVLMVNLCVPLWVYHVVSYQISNSQSERTVGLCNKIPN